MLPLKPPSAHLIFKGWCGFLADQLHWPTPKPLTPALRFGFAVDCWCGIPENLFTLFRSIPKKYHCGQAGAATEGPSPDAGNTVRDRETGQACAITEGDPPDAGDAVGYRDARQASAATKGLLPDAGDRLAFNGCRYG